MWLYDVVADIVKPSDAAAEHSRGSNNNNTSAKVSKVSQLKSSSAATFFKLSYIFHQR